MKKTGGRKKGSSNKVSRETKENIIIAFDRLNGVDGLVKWAKDNPTEFYKIWAKTLPLQVTGKDGDDLIPKTITIELIRAPSAP